MLCQKPLCAHLIAVITDTQGGHLFHLRTKGVGILPSYVGEDNDGNMLFLVTRRMSCKSIYLCTLGTSAQRRELIPVTPKLDAVFYNHTSNEEITLDLKGDFFGMEASITVRGGPLVAIISRQYGLRDAFTRAQTVSTADFALSSRPLTAVSSIGRSRCGFSPDRCYMYLLRRSQKRKATMKEGYCTRLERVRSIPVV